MACLRMILYHVPLLFSGCRSVWQAQHRNLRKASWPVGPSAGVARWLPGPGGDPPRPRSGSRSGSLGRHRCKAPAFLRQSGVFVRGRRRLSESAGHQVSCALLATTLHPCRLSLLARSTSRVHRWQLCRVSPDFHVMCLFPVLAVLFVLLCSQSQPSA